MKDKYLIWGKVREGKKRGKKLGFPTANFVLHKKIEQGIYISIAIFEDREYHSVTFIGNATTYGEKDVKAETYILDFSKNIYGKWISVRLLKKIRENKKFKSEYELIKRMNKDLEIVKKYFRSLYLFIW